MKVIHKFELFAMGVQWVEMPEGAEVVSIQRQGDATVMWAIVDPTRPTVRFSVRCFGTGQPITVLESSYLATVQDSSGYVWHYFKGWV